MTRKSLESGLAGWIKDTKETEKRIQEPVAQTSADKVNQGQVEQGQVEQGQVDQEQVCQEQVQPAEPKIRPIEIQQVLIADLEVPAPKLPPVENESLEWLKASLFRDGQLQPVVIRLVDQKPVLVTGYRRLRALKDLGHRKILAIVHAELSDGDARKLYLSDNLPRIQADPTVLKDLVASVGVAEAQRWGVPPALIEKSQHLDEAVKRQQTDGSPVDPKPQEPGSDGALRPGILAVDDHSFETEVVQADRPVLVAIHLPGQLSSNEIQQALIDAKEKWGDVKLCAIDMMSCDGPAVPQLVKVGRGFLEKHLPRVQLYHGGFQRNELIRAAQDNPLDADALVALLDFEISKT